MRVDTGRLVSLRVVCELSTLRLGFRCCSFTCQRVVIRLPVSRCLCTQLAHTDDRPSLSSDKVMTSSAGVLAAMVAVVALATGSWISSDGDAATDVENSSILEPVLIRRLTVDGIRNRDQDSRGKRRGGVVCTDVAGDSRKCFYEEFVEVRRAADLISDLMTAQGDRQPVASHDVGKRRRTLECYIGGRMGGCDYQDIKQAQAEDQHLNSIDSPGKRDFD